MTIRKGILERNAKKSIKILVKKQTKKAIERQRERGKGVEEEQGPA